MNVIRSLIPAFAVLATLAVSGCSDDDSNNNPVAPTPTGRVMAVHASPDAPAVDLVVDGAAVAGGLAFPSNTGYLSVPAGTRNIKVQVAGTTTTVIDANVDVSAGADYSVFANGPVASIGALVVADDLTPPAAGKAHVRFVHLSPDAPAVDVAVTGGPVLFADREFREYTAFAPVDAGTYDLEVRLAGTSTAVLPLPGISLQAGKIYTVFAKGFVAGTGSQALAAQIIVNN
jgi:hypothetical protein